MKPVLYLDVDGVLLTFPPVLEEAGLAAEAGQLGMTAAPEAARFLRWAQQHMEVRWLTAWAQGGDMREKRVQMLADHLDMNPVELENIPSLGWKQDCKPDGIFWVEHIARQRPFVWMDDDQMPHELTVLEDAGMLESFWHVDTFDDPMSLKRAWQQLAAHFNLPAPTQQEATRHRGSP